MQVQGAAVNAGGRWIRGMFLTWWRILGAAGAIILVVGIIMTVQGATASSALSHAPVCADPAKHTSGCRFTASGLVKSTNDAVQYDTSTDSHGLTTRYRHDTYTAVLSVGASSYNTEIPDGNLWSLLAAGEPVNVQIWDGKPVQINLTGGKTVATADRPDQVVGSGIFLLIGGICIIAFWVLIRVFARRSVRRWRNPLGGQGSLVPQIASDLPSEIQRLRQAADRYESIGDRARADVLRDYATQMDAGSSAYTGSDAVARAPDGDNQPTS
ncbi:MAG: hypothetical protein E6J45_12585 [Chloroflexi bacterium]|nr:MAG: hypothetical protein E6J45_12585 [Chloroflexota bacterium]